jgi:putative membrane protein
MKKTIAITTIVLAGFSAKAQIPQPDPDTTAKHFLVVASIKNLQEVNSGQLASQKASRPEVKSFGQMMIKDHGDAEQKLLALAKSQGISLPANSTGGIQPDLLLKNAGSNFDKLYVHGMVAGHGNTVQVFENYATTGKNPAIKVFAQQMLPVIKRHLAEIKAIDRQIK